MKKIRLTLLLSILLLAPSGAQAALTDGLVGHWTLDGKDVNWATGSVNDLSGQGNNGKVVSMSTTTSPVIGKVGQGFTFNGTNQYVNTGFSMSSRTKFTISAWVKRNALGSKVYSATNVDTPGGYAQFGFWTDGLIYVTPDATGGFMTTPSNTTNWIHIVYVFDGAQGTAALRNRVWLNGVESSMTGTVASTATNASAGTIDIGRRLAFSTYTDGKIDDFRVYDRAISAQEVRQLYALGASKIASSPTKSVAQGLVRYWTLDGKDINWATGTANDATGQGHTGKLNSMSTTTTPTLGRIGQGLRFDATNDSIRTTTNFSLPSAMTVSVWAKTPTPSHTGILLAQRDSGNNNYNFQFYMASQTLVGRIAGTATTIYIGRKTGAVITDKNWHLYTMTWDGGTTASSIKLYIDGVQSDTTDDNGGSFTTPSVNSFPIEIGTQNVGSNTFDGTIDDARIYNRALSASEIRQLYSAGSAKQAVSPADVLKSGLVGHWTMDGKDMDWSTGSVTDRSGQGNTGKVAGMSTTTSPTIGKIGQGLRFDGTDDFVNINAGFGTFPFTVCTWFYPSVEGSYILFSTYFNSSHYHELSISGSPLQLNATSRAGVAGAASSVKTGVLQNSWNFGCGVWEAADIRRAYLNGVPGDVQITSRNPTSAISSQIGSRVSGSSFNGIIDEVRVFNRALSEQEIRQLYSLGRSTLR